MLDLAYAPPKPKVIQGARHDWELVIGLEVHAQVSSQAKLFSGASTAFGAEPNHNVSFVDAAPNHLGFPSQPAGYSDETSAAIDRAIRRIVDTARERAETLLAEHRPLLERGAEQLLEQETLDEDAIRTLFAELDEIRLSA